jgi:hypothetical protein
MPVDIGGTMVHFATIAHLLEGELYRAHVSVLERYSAMLQNDVHNTAILTIPWEGLEAGQRVAIVSVDYDGEEEQVWFVGRVDGASYRLHPDWLVGVP